MKQILPFIFIILLLIPHPVAASSNMNEGESMIFNALNALPQHIADIMLAGNYFESEGNSSDDVTKGGGYVQYGNDSNLSNSTLSQIEAADPSIKYINNLKNADNGLYNQKWVQEEIQAGYLNYVKTGLLVILLCFGYFFFQKIKPEQAGEFTEFFTGAQRYIGYATFIKTTILLMILPTLLPFLFSYSIDLEAGLSNGINITSAVASATSNDALYFFQSISFFFNSLFLQMRLSFLNDVHAKMLFLALALAIPWRFIRYMGIGIILYFETVLFLRPVCMYVNTYAMTTLSEMTATQSSSIAQAVMGAAANLSFLIVIAALAWPAVYLIYLLWTSRRGRTVIHVVNTMRRF